jgi:hypothetical protein
VQASYWSGAEATMATSASGRRPDLARRAGVGSSTMSSNQRETCSRNSSPRPKRRSSYHPASWTGSSSASGWFDVNGVGGVRAGSAHEHDVTDRHPGQRYEILAPIEEVAHVARMWLSLWVCGSRGW